jgi:anti-sigma factor RsiW
VLSCQDLLAELSNLVDDDLPAAVRKELEHHLAECRTCQVLYDSMRKTLVVVTESASFPLPDGVGERIRERVMARIRAGVAADDEPRS